MIIKISIVLIVSAILIAHICDADPVKGDGAGLSNTEDNSGPDNKHIVGEEEVTDGNDDDEGVDEGSSNEGTDRGLSVTGEGDGYVERIGGFQSDPDEIKGERVENEDIPPVKRADIIEKRCTCTHPCKGQACTLLTNTCSSNGLCYCFKLLNGSGICTISWTCGTYPDCTVCSPSTSVCVMDTCCGGQECIPLSLGDTCKEPPTRAISKSNNITLTNSTTIN